MIKVVQFGEGNFLRTFADAYFDTLNEEGESRYGVTVIKPIPVGTLEKFERQNNRYHIVLRGTEEGKPVEKVRKINVLDRVFSPFEDESAFYAAAREKDLRLIVSNTTEAGICFNESDPFDGFEQITYPAKLTKFLYERYRAGLDGVYLLPVELIENNADELRRHVDGYVRLWNLPQGFAEWNATRNYYCNTLVDRIVSGYPRDEETQKHLETLVGERDELLSVGEPFGLWAIEKKGEIGRYIKEGIHNIEVVLTDDIGYYKKRKVRVLNGSHTNLVAAGLLSGKETVYDCMTDERLSAFVDGALREEIIPFVSDDVAATAAYAESVKERFLNPFLNHRLESIALNSLSKWRARVLPSFRDYYARYHQIPRRLTLGFSCLMALYRSRYGELKDEEKFLSYFAEGRPLKEIMSDCAIWGEDLTAYAGFYEAVKENAERIARGEI